jgi:hypothetical protein
VKSLEPMRLRAWTLPLIVAAVAVPITAAFILGGPPAGLAAGALAVFVLLWVAARAQFDEEIEVARPADDRYRVLVVALRDVSDTGDAEELARAAQTGAEQTGLTWAAPELLVLAPALNSRLAHWASDLDRARGDAQRRLTVSIAALAGAGAQATGRVGDSEPLVAVEDTLRTYPAQEVALLVSGDDADEALLEEIRRRLDRPVRVLPG